MTSSQQSLISDALTALRAGTRIPDVPDDMQELVRDGLIQTLAFALVDHRDGECPHLPGRECFATSRARQILEARKEANA